MATTATMRVTVIPAMNNLARISFSNEYVKKRVAAYARVSTDEEEQLNSYEAQCEYFTELIQDNDEWEFAGMYSDKDRSGTTTKRRDGFNKMIKDALDGKIDLIITKSISRFARNTVDTLSTVRQLKEKGIEVYFQKENIYTLDSKGELLITIMSSLAQEESRSISENVTWGTRKRFADGKVSLPYKQFLGYERGEDGIPKIVEAEAEIIRRIYRLFLYGKAPSTIASILTRDGIPTPGGKYGWLANTVISILTNEKYKGDALLQKKFTVDFLTKKQKINEGEVPQYYVENSHPAIINRDVFDLIQEEMQKRKASGKLTRASRPFSGKVICGKCGSGYGSKVWNAGTKYQSEVWYCNGRHYGGKKCDTPRVTDADIQAGFVSAFNEVLSDKDGILEAYGEIRDVLTDTASIDKEREGLEQERDVVVELMKKCIDENATAALDQQEYTRRYTGYVERLEAAKKRLAELDAERRERVAQRTKISWFLETLEQHDELITDFDEEMWFTTVESVTVGDDRRLTFTFKSGVTVTV